MDDPFAERWQCHSCHQILDPDTVGTFRDGPLDDRGTYVNIIKCTGCNSTDVGDFDAKALVNELGRIVESRMVVGVTRIPTSVHYIDRGNMEQIQIILEKVFEL